MGYSFKAGILSYEELVFVGATLGWMGALAGYLSALDLDRRVAFVMHGSFM